MECVFKSIEVKTLEQLEHWNKIVIPPPVATISLFRATFHELIILALTEKRAIKVISIKGAKMPIIETYNKIPNNIPTQKNETTKDDSIKSQARLTIDAKQAAAVLGISYWSILELCKRGEIPYIPVGSRKLFRMESLTAWLTEREAGTTKQ